MGTPFKALALVPKALPLGDVQHVLQKHDAFLGMCHGNMIAVMGPPIDGCFVIT
jgi:hypothetical protein